MVKELGFLSFVASLLFVLVGIWSHSTEAALTGGVFFVAGILAVTYPE